MSQSAKPLVSICCITFNHEKYIHDAIEGFLIQKTNFPFEIIIHDDASTDNTAQIIKEYERKHPDLFVAIYQTENQYSQGIKPWPNFVFPRARGKYIALCEGDDYWTDPLKLQKQVEFLEENPDCSLCFHASKDIQENNQKIYKIRKPEQIPKSNKFGIQHVILKGGGFMATNSMVFLREYCQNQPDWMYHAPVGDGPLMLLLASKGKIGYIDEVMSVYRKMAEGSWSASMKDRNKRKAHIKAVLKMYDEFDHWTNFKFHNYVVRKKLKSRWSLLKGSLLYNIKKVTNKR